MKKNILAVILMLFVLEAHANEWSGNINFFLGQKLLDNDDWGDLDQQDTFGVLVDFKPNHWPVSIALDFLGSYAEVLMSLMSVFVKYGKYRGVQ